MQENIQEKIKRQREWIANVRKAAEKIDKEWIARVREAASMQCYPVYGGGDSAYYACTQRAIFNNLDCYDDKDITPRDANRDRHIQTQRFIQKVLNELEESLSAMEKAYGGKS